MRNCCGGQIARATAAQAQAPPNAASTPAHATLTVTQCGIKDANIVGIIDAARDVFRALRCARPADDCPAGPADAHAPCQHPVLHHSLHVCCACAGAAVESPGRRLGDCHDTQGSPQLLPEIRSKSRCLIVGRKAGAASDCCVRTCTGAVPRAIRRLRQRRQRPTQRRSNAHQDHGYHTDLLSPALPCPRSTTASIRGGAHPALPLPAHACTRTLC